MCSPSTVCQEHKALLVERSFNEGINSTFASPCARPRHNLFAQLCRANRKGGVKYFQWRVQQRPVLPISHTSRVEYQYYQSRYRDGAIATVPADAAIVGGGHLLAKDIRWPKFGGAGVVPPQGGSRI